MDRFATLAHLIASLPPLQLTAVSLAILTFAGYLWLYPIAYARLAYRNLPGPDPGSFFWGNITGVFAPPTPNSAHADWHKAHGHTIKYRMQFGSHDLSTIDPAALSYIVNNPYIFDKPPVVKAFLGRLVGAGVILSTGDHHRNQRKIMGPAFGQGAVKEMFPVFYDVSYALKDKLRDLISSQGRIVTSPSPIKPSELVAGGAKIDVLKYLTLAAFDIIGISGFGFVFNSLSGEKNMVVDLAEAFLQSGSELGVQYILKQYFPFTLLVSVNQNVCGKGRSLWRGARAGTSLTRKRIQEILDITSGEGVQKRQDIGKDLLSLLVKSNMASDLKENERLAEDDIADQILTILLAGGETTSSAASATLRFLTQYPDVQDRLRKELLTIDEDRPSTETLNKLPYLEAVIREAIRLAPGVSLYFRTVVHDVIIPFSQPLVGADGKLMTEVKMKRGDQLFLPLAAINTSSALWGPDGESFNPSRWLQDDPNKVKLPGVYGNNFTFVGGTRYCIGYRFALQQIKVVLFVLLRGFDFQELKSKPELFRATSSVVQTYIRGEEHLGTQNPLMVVPLGGSAEAPAA
ncbi:hypothetical protein L202_03609 [Cryptococcus amylolentus CBS 6039]|uniref:Cytochrome P450 n=1 Tax=Cryptococcus amylolentus CBS 6039 TaxID=1295533 RepID=A0A1E3HTI9_9TREE|nr:hypothetical protein L202_03609 [Cryptococcus amylolentus CBS 6039]ODN79678.1 hypothetical protein L202_03609 [Cryptococcus amylolentus CBS 6039]